jgi:hypothetical protein
MVDLMRNLGEVLKDGGIQVSLKVLSLLRTSNRRHMDFIPAILCLLTHPNSSTPTPSADAGVDRAKTQAE